MSSTSWRASDCDCIVAAGPAPWSMDECSLGSGEEEVVCVLEPGFASLNSMLWSMRSKVLVLVGF